MMSRPNPKQVDQVLVLGGGIIGCSWTAYFLAQGLDVYVHEPIRPEDQARTDIQRMLDALQAWPDSQTITPGNLRFQNRLCQIPPSVEFVQEAIVEDLSAKKSLLSEVELVVAEDTVICTSTSSLLPSDIQADCMHPERVLAGHPFNPPHLLPVVEVVPGKRTSPATVDWTMRFYRTIGKVPVQVKKEVVGHIANRLTSALFREAVHILAEGIGTAKDVDDVITHGPGLRYALLGPFLTYHLGGGAEGIRGYLDHLGATHPARWATLGNPSLDQAVQDIIVESVLQEYGGQDMADLEAARDRRLQELLRMKSERPPRD